MAGREKDYEFVCALISEAMVELKVIEQRLDMVSAATHEVAIERARRFVQRSIDTRTERRARRAR